MTRLPSTWIPMALAGLSLAWTVPHLDDLGITWDEPFYFASVERIQDWYGTLIREPGDALPDSAIRAAWDPPEYRYWNPHPPAYKQLMALTGALFGPALGRVAAFRASSAILLASLVAAVSLTALRVAGPLAALGAGASLLAMPRLVGHGHIAATDMPLATFWFIASVGLALHALGGRRRLLLAAGASLGLAMATKFTGWLLPVPVLAWCLLERRWRGFGAWLAVAFLVAWIATPPAWSHPFEQVGALFRESLSRASTAPIPTRYLGGSYGLAAPWHLPIVLTLVTVPLGVLALSAAGLARFVVDTASRSRSKNGPSRDLLAPIAGMSILQIAFFVALIALPTSPDHDGVRQFLPMFPFLALLSGLGLAAVARWMALRAGPGRLRWVVVVVAVMTLVPGLVQTIRVAPFYLSYYSGLIGGLSGAAERGMEISYWHDSMTPDLLRRVEDRLPRGARVRVTPSPGYAVSLQTLGLLRSDLQIVDEPEAPYLLMTARMANISEEMASVYRACRPVVRTSLDGVTLSALYDFTDRSGSGATCGAAIP